MRPTMNVERIRLNITIHRESTKYGYENKPKRIMTGFVDGKAVVHFDRRRPTMNEWNGL